MGSGCVPGHFGPYINWYIKSPFISTRLSTDCVFHGLSQLSSESFLSNERRRPEITHLLTGAQRCCPTAYRSYPQYRTLTREVDRSLSQVIRKRLSLRSAVVTGRSPASPPAQYGARLFAAAGAAGSTRLASPATNPKRGLTLPER